MNHKKYQLKTEVLVDVQWCLHGKLLSIIIIIIIKYKYTIPKNKKKEIDGRNVDFLVNFRSSFFSNN